MRPPDVIRQILTAGTLAPSADNSQPWRFEVEAEAVRLRVDPTRAHSVSDVDRALTHISCGAVIENMAVAAAALGQEARITLFPRPDDRDLVAELRWVPGSPGSDDLARAIPDRHTNRKFYRRQAVPAAALDHLAREARAFPGAALDWLTDPRSRAAALRLMRQAEAERFRREPLHQELFRTIRFDVGWRRPAEEGLPPGALEVELPARPFFGALRHWAVMSTLNRLGAHRILGWRSADLPARIAPAFGVLTIPSASAESVILGGRALQRVWLRATALGLALQPFCAATILPLQLGLTGSPIPEGILRQLSDRLAALTGRRPGIAFLRVGYAPPSRIRTGRRSVESFLA